MSIRNQYQKLGVEAFYKKNSDSYENPHEKIVHYLLDIANKKGHIGKTKILDLCCGTGQVSNHLKKIGYSNIVGCDPFTNIEFQKRTNLKAYNYDFRYIAMKGLSEKYSTIICSFALHLAPASLLPQLLWQLSQSCEKLIIISPNKKPEIKNHFIEVDSFKDNRVICKIYESVYK